MKNYLPVSLLSVLSKVAETIVASRVTEHLEVHHLLCTRQFGFRQGRSAADLHLLLSSELSAALDQGKKTAVMVLDIEGAFDRVWHEALVAKLRSAGIDGALLPLLRDYLRDRQLRVTVCGRESELQPIRAGVPQGSCLGPLLWNIQYISTTCCTSSQERRPTQTTSPSLKATSFRKRQPSLPSSTTI